MSDLLEINRRCSSSNHNRHINILY